jgi:hypothetical protein
MLFKEFLYSEDLADLLITVNRTFKFHAHSQLLSMASPYFRTLLKPCWLQTNNVHTETNEPIKIDINLPGGTSLDTFQTLL